MANKKSTPSGEAATESSLSASAEPTSPATDSGEAWDQQLSELKELTRSLMFAVQEMRTQSARNDMLRNTIDDVKADVRAASQAMLMAPTPSAVASAPTHREGKCGPCECVSDGCCCFDIIISKVRAAKPQIEPADAGDVGPLINALEVQMYFTVDNVGFLWPGLSTTMDLRADGLPGGPGTWVVIERAVNRVCIPKGATVTKELKAEVREHDEGVERPIGMKDELGEANGSITLDCCMTEIFPPMPIDVYLMFGGEGRGMVQIAYYARRVCC